MDENILGKRIRQARRTQDLTQQELGAKAGVNYSTISRIENGEYIQLYASIVYALAKSLNVSLDWLYGWKEDSHV